MKTTSRYFVVCLAVTLSATAQTATNSPTNPNLRSPWTSLATNTTGLRTKQPKETPAALALSGSSSRTIVSSSVIERGPHHRVTRFVSAQTNWDGRILRHTNSYRELATGMHYLETGVWKETKELIEPFEDGAIARHGPHKVIFGTNLNTAGVIDMETPDGKRLRSHVLGLGYFDTVSGQSVLIAEVKDSVGRIAGSNQVVYADAFTDIKADLQYTYTRAGLEQDVVLRESPPKPEDFGLKTASSRLQVLTEFLSPPVPAKTNQTVITAQGDTATDELLDFGEMKMQTGKAFRVGQKEADDAKIVTKRWLKLETRDVLIEEIRVRDVITELAALPKSASLQNPKQNARVASVKQTLPARREPAAKTGEMLVAKVESPKPGFVLDYIISSGPQWICHCCPQPPIGDAVQPLIYAGHFRRIILRNNSPSQASASFPQFPPGICNCRPARFAVAVERR